MHYYRVIVSDPQSNPLAKPVTISRMQAPAKNEDVEDDGRSSIAKSTSVLERSSTRVSPLRRDRVHLPRAGSTTSSDCSEVIPRRRHHHRRASSATLDRVDSGFDGSSTSLPVDNAPTRASSALLNHRHHEDAALLLESECSVCALMDASNNVHQHLCTTQSKTTIPSKNATMAPGLTLAELRQIKEELKRSKLPLTFTAHFFASDDDYLMTRSVREYFKANALAHEGMWMLL